MKFRLSIGALLAAATLASGALARAPQQPEAQPAARHVSDKAGHTPFRSASMPFELKDNLVTLDTVINGRPHRAVLDSGASAFVVDQDFARVIGLSEGQSIGDVAGAGSQKQQLRPVTLTSLSVGPLRFADVSGYSVNLKQLTASAGFPINLLIGAPAFKAGAVTVDYKRNRVTFSPSGSGRTCAAPIPLTIVHDVPVVEVLLKAAPDSEPVRLKLVVDMGTRHQALIVGGPYFRSKAGQALAGAGTPRKIGHGTGGEVEGSVVRIAELRIGATRVTDLDVALSSGVAAVEAGGLDGILGVPFWNEGVITFDYQAKSVCIER